VASAVDDAAFTIDDAATAVHDPPDYADNDSDHPSDRDDETTQLTVRELPPRRQGTTLEGEAG
jgi:hypothetical protein